MQLYSQYWKKQKEYDKVSKGLKFCYNRRYPKKANRSSSNFNFWPIIPRFKNKEDEMQGSIVKIFQVDKQKSNHRLNIKINYEEYKFLVAQTEIWENKTAEIAIDKSKSK